MKDLMWGRRFLKANPSERDEDENKNSASPDGADSQESEPLAVILVNTIFHLLFLPDFTIDDPNVEFSANDVNSPEFKSALMWAPGVGKPSIYIYVLLLKQVFCILYICRPKIIFY